MSLPLVCPPCHSPHPQRYSWDGNNSRFSIPNSTHTSSLIPSTALPTDAIIFCFPFPRPQPQFYPFVQSRAARSKNTFSPPPICRGKCHQGSEMPPRFLQRQISLSRREGLGHGSTLPPAESPRGDGVRGEYASSPLGLDFFKKRRARALPLGAKYQPPARENWRSSSSVRLQCRRAPSSNPSNPKNGGVGRSGDETTDPPQSRFMLSVPIHFRF